MANNNILIAVAMAEHHISEPVHTYENWKSKGFHVQKGEKALFQTKIWRPCKIKRTDKNGNVHSDMKLLLVNASFFGMSQVKKSMRRK